MCVDTFARANDLMAAVKACLQEMQMLDLTREKEEANYEMTLLPEMPLSTEIIQAIFTQIRDGEGVNVIHVLYVDDALPSKVVVRGLYE